MRQKRPDWARTWIDRLNDGVSLHLFDCITAIAQDSSVSPHSHRNTHCPQNPATVEVNMWIQLVLDRNTDRLTGHRRHCFCQSILWRTVKDKGATRDQRAIMVQDIPLLRCQTGKSPLPLRQVGATDVTIISGTPVPGGYAKTGLVLAP